LGFQLTPDPSGIRDFLVAAGAQVTISAGSDSGLIRILGATLNGAPQQPDGGGKLMWRAAQGTNLLNVAFAGPDPDELFRIEENGAAGSTQVLAAWKLAPGGGVPGGLTRAFRIYAA
jgi:hypothetical protein